MIAKSFFNKINNFAWDTKHAWVIEMGNIHHLVRPVVYIGNLQPSFFFFSFFISSPLIMVPKISSNIIYYLYFKTYISFLFIFIYINSTWLLSINSPNEAWQTNSTFNKLKAFRKLKTRVASQIPQEIIQKNSKKEKKIHNELKIICNLTCITYCFQHMKKKTIC